MFSVNPFNYVSNMFLSAAVYNRFFQPQLHILSKVDYPQKYAKQSHLVQQWTEDALH